MSPRRRQFHPQSFEPGGRVPVRPGLIRRVGQREVPRQVLQEEKGGKSARQP